MTIRIAVIPTAGELSSLECDVLSSMLEAKAEQFYRDRGAYLCRNDTNARIAREAAAAAYEQAPTFTVTGCPDCDALRYEGDLTAACATHRCACEGCGASDELHTGDITDKTGENGAFLWEHWCNRCDPVIERSGYRDADPWDLSQEEQAENRITIPSHEMTEAARRFYKREPCPDDNRDLWEDGK